LGDDKYINKQQSVTVGEGSVQGKEMNVIVNEKGDGEEEEEVEGTSTLIPGQHLSRLLGQVRPAKRQIM